MDQQLQHILRFAQKTNDKVIVTDPEGKEPMVVMPFAMYEHLIQVGRNTSGIQESAQNSSVSPEPLDDLAVEPSAPVQAAPVAPPEAVETVPLPDQESAPDPESELPGEEEFYLEPVS